MIVKGKCGMLNISFFYVPFKKKKEKSCQKNYQKKQKKIAKNGPKLPVNTTQS